MPRWLLFLSAFLGLIALASGQEFRASIVGRVSDSSGAVVPNAQVTATHLDTSVAVKTQTTATGDYVLTALQPGTYRLEVELAGFKKYVREGITLNIQERPAIDVTLEAGEVSTSVTVTAEASQLEVSNASRGELITGKVLVDLPLNGRNAFALAGLAPGVAMTVRGQASTFLRPTANNGISGMALSGGLPRQNEVLLDGVPNTGSDGLIQFVPSVDAAQEFKVQTNSFDAEFGRFTGGVINAMIKSGTNDLHGTAFWFVRNSAFNARDPFATRIPQFGYNLYGFSTGGPVVLPNCTTVETKRSGSLTTRVRARVCRARLSRRFRPRCSGRATFPKLVSDLPAGSPVRSPSMTRRRPRSRQAPGTARHSRAIASR